MILFIAFELNVCVNGVTTNKRDEVSDVHRLYFFQLCASPIARTLSHTIHMNK